MLVLAPRVPASICFWMAEPANSPAATIRMQAMTLVERPMTYLLFGTKGSSSAGAGNGSPWKDVCSSSGSVAAEAPSASP
jgi:hypothetical protein